MKFFSALLILVLLFAATKAQSTEKAVGVEDIQDPELRAQIISQLTARQKEDSPAGEEEGGPAFAPAPGKRASKLRGVFILCERKGSKPNARLFKSSTNTVSVVTTGSCTNTVHAPASHHTLWPVFGEEFDELCSYVETLHACTSGQVTVKRGDQTIFRCNKTWDAHSVTFSLSTSC